MLGPIACLLIGVGLILFFLLYLRLHPFLALVISALVCAAASDRIPIAEAVPTVAEGFAGLMGKIGILLVLASIIGKGLVESGSADRIIRTFSRVFGEAREHLSFLASGFVLAMPVFFDTVFYLLAPLIRAAYSRKKRDYTLMLCAAAAGGAITHALVPPTPGPVVVAEALHVSLGLTFVIGVLVSIPPAIVGGIFYARFLNRRLVIRPRAVYGVTTEEMEAAALRPDAELPSFWAAISPVVVPVALISVSTLVTVLSPGGRLDRIFQIIGDKDIAFFLGAFLAIGVVVSVKGCRVREISELLEPAIASGTTIAFITCAGGAFGQVLTRSGVGEVISAAASDWELSLLTLAFILAALIRIAQGSATVAMITTAGIIGPALATTSLSYHPVYLVGMIGFGATTTPWMNDSGFWIVCKMAGLTESETLKTWTVLLTVIAVTGYVWILILSRLMPLV